MKKVRLSLSYLHSAAKREGTVRRHSRAKALALLPLLLLTAVSCSRNAWEPLSSAGTVCESAAVSDGRSSSEAVSSAFAGESSASFPTGVSAASAPRRTGVVSRTAAVTKPSAVPARAQTKTAASSWPAGGPVPSPLALPSIDGSKVFANSSASIDLSYTSYGFVKIRLVKALQTGVKVWIHGGSGDYYYDLSRDGSTEIYPLQMGSGSYSISVLQKGPGGSYYYLASTNVNVRLTSSRDPFLVPNQIVSYGSGSRAVAIARGLVAGMSNNYQRISTVLSYVASHISYDTALAKTVKTGYVPDVDAALSKGRGICYDYAAVSAAMLRCLGYPTKLLTGYVENGAVYHAWNEVYLSGQGWVKVLSVKVNTGGWSRVDVTFISSATSSSQVAKYIGDGSNYRTVYVY